MNYTCLIIKNKQQNAIIIIIIIEDISDMVTLQCPCGMVSGVNIFVFYPVSTLPYTKMPLFLANIFVLTLIFGTPKPYLA